MSDTLFKASSEKVVIFGAGKAGQAAYEKLKAECEVVAFCDNRLIEERVCGLKVVSPESLKHMVFDRVCVASEYFEQIQQQLINDLGIESNKVSVLSAAMIKELSFGDSEATAYLAEQILLLVCRIFDEHGIRYYVDAGTLLGIYRDDALIPWDDDLDIAIMSRDVTAVEQVLEEVLEGLKGVTQCDWTYGKHYSQQEFGAVKKGELRSYKLKCLNDLQPLPMLDLFVKYVNGDVMDYAIASRGITMPSKHMLLPLFKYSFRDQVIKLPNDPESYLELHYGDWKTPIKEWDLSMLKNATVFERDNN